MYSQNNAINFYRKPIQNMFFINKEHYMNNTPIVYDEDGDINMFNNEDDISILTIVKEKIWDDVTMLDIDNNDICEYWLLLNQGTKDSIKLIENIENHITMEYLSYKINRMKIGEYNKYLVKINRMKTGEYNEYLVKTENE